MGAITEALLRVVQSGGTLVDSTEAARREAICRECPSVGKVDFFGSQLAGCTLCRCPLATLTRAKRHVLKGIVMKTVRCSDENTPKW